MRVIESIMFAIIFLALNVWLIGQLSMMGFGIVVQLLMTWFVTGVLVCACYFYHEERKRMKNDEPSSG